MCLNTEAKSVFSDILFTDKILSSEVMQYVRKGQQESYLDQIYFYMDPLPELISCVVAYMYLTLHIEDISPALVENA